MATCANCSRSFDGDKCLYRGSVPQLVLHDSPVPNTSPWWARPTDFVGWKYRIGFCLLLCFATVWTVGKLGWTLSILLGVVALGIVMLVIWLRYRDDELQSDGCRALGIPSWLLLNLSDNRVNQALAQVPEFRDPENYPISWALIPAVPGR